MYNKLPFSNLICCVAPENWIQEKNPQKARKRNKRRAFSLSLQQDRVILSSPKVQVRNFIKQALAAKSTSHHGQDYH
jgi:hypothetical protein